MVARPLAVWLCALVCTVCNLTAQCDIGYELLFEDALEEFDDPSKPLNFSTFLPDYLKGTFVQTGPARWSWSRNGQVVRRMTHALDGYSKLHKFDFRTDGTVAFASKFLRSGFYRESERLQDIGYAVFAQPLDPPRATPISAFASAPNDNNQVNVFQFGNGSDRVELLSDTTTLIEVEQSSLQYAHEYNNMVCSKELPKGQCSPLKNMTDPLGDITVGASAHPWLSRDGDYIGLREISRVVPIPMMKEGYAVYRIGKDQKDTVEDLVKIPVPRTSYTHSFGLASTDRGDYVVVAQQPLHYNVIGLLEAANLLKGLVSAKEPSRFWVAPLQAGAKAVEVEVPVGVSGQGFFFGHIVNTYSPEPNKFVADINMQDGIFFDRFDLATQRNKSLRDSWPTQEKKGISPGYMTVARYTIDLEAKTVTYTPLWGHSTGVNIENEFDLFRLHPDDYGKPYCGFWALQSYYNSTAWASWAIVRTEICGEKPKVAAAWHRPNVYPGEAAFVPKPGSEDKTEGVLVFKTTDGTTGKSSLVVADAKTLNTISEAELPIRIPFTVHGNFFARPVRTPEGATGSVFI